MPATTEASVYGVGCVVLAALLVTCSLVGLTWLLGRSRPGFAIGTPVTVAVGIRVVLTIALGLLAPAFRGGDEGFFLLQARQLADQPFVAGVDIGAITPLHIWLFSLELRAGFPELAIRIVQIGIGVAGIALFAAAVYELAGARAGLIAAWLLAVEPAAAFFGGLLHKEAFMTFATGLVAFGGAKVWTKGHASAFALVAGGLLIALATRPYAGWALTAGAGVVVAHYGLSSASVRRRSLVAPTLALAVVLSLVPFLLIVSGSNLERLQASQEVNTRDSAALALEPLDYSSRVDLVRNAPVRVRDLLLRPYPWQLTSTNQRLGFLGTAFALTTLLILIVAVARRGFRALLRAGPILYPAAFLLAVYSLTSGNAGTGFRHRTQLISLGICLAVVLLRQRPGTLSAWPSRVAPEREPGARLVARSVPSYAVARGPRPWSDLRGGRLDRLP